MKKVISVLLAVMLLAALSVTAFASSAGVRNQPVAGDVLYLSDDASDALVKQAIDSSKADSFKETKGYQDIAKEAADKGYESIEIDKAGKVSSTDPEVTKGWMKLKVSDDFVGLVKMTKDADGNDTWEKQDFQFTNTEKGKKEIKTYVEVDQLICVLVGTPAKSDATGESIPYGLLIAAVVLAGGSVVFFRKSRKANA